MPTDPCRPTLVSLALALAAAAPVVLAGPPAYTIVDLGVADPGDFGSQGLGASAGGVGSGTSLGSGATAFVWTESGGTVFLPNPASPARAFARANGANDSGQAVGTGATTFFGSSPLPLIWNGTTVSVLPLPAGQTLGRANGINDDGLAVGSVNGGSLERACLFTESAATIITTTTGDAEFMTTALGVNNAGLVVGNGLDPSNAARNVGLVYDSGADTMTDIGALPGRNGALCFGVGDAGHVTGSSMLNQGSGLPFVWTEAGGMVEIPLPPGASGGSGRDVNIHGEVVGNAGGVFAVPWYYDGSTTVAIADLLPPGSGWDLDMNTSSGATGISDGGIIIGTGEFLGEVRAYALIPADASCSAADLADPLGSLDFNDVVAFLTAFSMSQPEADLAEPIGFFDFNDVVAYLTIFAAGCP